MSRAIPNLQLFLILIFLSLVIFALDVAQYLNFPKQISFYITNPISFGLYRNSQVIGKQFYFIFAARFAAQENKALKEQLGQLFAENANLKRRPSRTGTIK